MKEVMVVIRQSKVNETKEALAAAGFPSFTCQRCLGRGNTHLHDEVLAQALTGEESLHPHEVEHISESSRLVAKRVFVLVTEDENVQKIIDVLMEVNSTGRSGDGKIFVLPIIENVQVRNGEAATDAY